jgi:hypothetical protein
MNINPETGLPSLPGGYFWRVENASRYSTDPSAIIVRLMQKIVRKVSYPVKLHWWSLRYTTLTNEEHEEVYITGHYAKGVHPQAILDAANVCIKKWEQEKIRNSLLGDYPPKSLN